MHVRSHPRPLFVSHNSEEIKLVYKSIYNKRKNQVILLMINDESNNYYYFAIKNLLELKPLGWLRGKKEAMINNNNNIDFQNALDDALDYQTMEKDPQRISKLKAYINKCNWKGIDFPAGSKDWVKFGKNNEKIALNVLHIPRNTKTISVAYKSKYDNKHKKQVILLMITNGKEQHYLALAEVSAFFQKNIIKS